ncbi:unnamed protein product, partial [Dibothriocephalus latus]
MSRQLCFAFNSELLEDHGQEQNFEMAKAKVYASSAAEVDPGSKKIMFTSDVCPEMTHMVIKAKTDFPDLWPHTIDEYSVAELIFKLKSECLALAMENENLRKTFPDRQNNPERAMTQHNQPLHTAWKYLINGTCTPLLPKECRSESPANTVPSATSYADFRQQEQQQPLTSRIVEHNYSTSLVGGGGGIPASAAAPGMNTILEYVEGNKPEVSQLAMPTLTVNLRDRVDRICQLFAEGDNSSSFLTVPTSAAAAAAPPPP